MWTNLRWGLLLIGMMGCQEPQNGSPVGSWVVNYDDVETCWYLCDDGLFFGTVHGPDLELEHEGQWWVHDRGLPRLTVAMSTVDLLDDGNDEEQVQFDKGYNKRLDRLCCQGQDYMERVVRDPDLCL